MFNPIIVVIILFFSFLSSAAFPWGATTGFNTHGVIDIAAHKVLSKDPAFEASVFPTIGHILKYEGIEILMGKDGIGTGEGPDSAGKSNFSDHYFNPQTGKGNGPGAVARHYLNYQMNLLNGDASSVYKDFAWGAHFLADMSVVYHITGMPYDEFWREYSKQASTGKFILPATISGDINILSYAQVQRNDDFIKQARVIKGKAESTVDWFDPWYWNGNPMPTMDSSHVSWEMWVRDSIDIEGMGYNEFWVNPSPSFDHYMDNQALALKKMTAGAAATTFVNLENFAKNSMPPLQEATRNVATLWRASISALKPKLDVMPFDNNGSEIKFKVLGFVENVATETATVVQIRLITDGCSIIDGSKGIIDLKNLPTGKSDINEWVVRTTDLSKCKLKLETIGSYKKTPDLQYNNLNYNFKLANDATSGTLSHIFNFDLKVLNEDSTVNYTTGTFGSGIAAALTKNGDKFSTAESDGTQSVSLEAVIAGNGATIQKAELKNTFHDSSSGNTNIDANIRVLLQNVPIKYSYPLGGGIFIYAFWAKPKEIKKYTTLADYNGSGTYLDHDQDGNEVWKNFTLINDGTNWETSSIYFEFVNKTPEEVKDLIDSGKLTLDELNKNIETWQKRVAEELQR